MDFIIIQDTTVIAAAASQTTALQNESQICTDNDSHFTEHESPLAVPFNRGNGTSNFVHPTWSHMGTNTSPTTDQDWMSFESGESSSPKTVLSDGFDGFSLAVPSDQGNGTSSWRYPCLLGSVSLMMYTSTHRFHHRSRLAVVGDAGFELLQHYPKRGVPGAG